MNGFNWGEWFPEGAGSPNALGFFSFPAVASGLTVVVGDPPGDIGLTGSVLVSRRS